MAWSPLVQAATLAGTAYRLAAQSRVNPMTSLVAPQGKGWAMADIIRYGIAEPADEHLLCQVDVGCLLPDPAPDVHTAALIAFRKRYDDERQRLINAVERMVEQLSTVYGDPVDIQRSVRRDLGEALIDMTNAGRGVLRGWTRRVLSIFTAIGTGTAAGTLAGAPAVVTVVPAVACSLAVNIVTNPIPSGWQDDRYRNFHYLYRLRQALDNV